MIVLRGVTFGYPRGPKVLDGLDFEFEKGDRVGLVGPNGCGKTTLLHVVMGLLKPQAGEVEIFGKRREAEADFREVRERVGLLFQDPNDQLFSPTVAEDVAFGPFNIGKERDEVRGIVRETLDAVGLAGFGERVTYRLSGGEKRLVSLATVLAMKPEALLLDEPTAGLDEETEKRAVEILKDSGLSLIVISHDRRLLGETTDRLLTMRGGRIEAI